MAERGRGVDRRWVVSGLLGAAVLPATACGIRLEDDAPRVPLVPTRTPVPVEEALVALTRDTVALASAAAALDGDLAADLAALHRRQHTVLRTTLLRRQVPADDLDAPAPAGSSAAPSPSGSSASSSPSPSPTVDGRAALGALEAAAAAAAGTFADVEDDLRATVAALHAQRHAAATLLAGRAPDVPSDPVGGDTVARVVALTEAAIWLLEVVSARSSGRQRDRSDATLVVLRALRADQLSGGARSESALGHALPFPVDSAADAARLAREVLTALRADLGPLLAPLVAEHGATGLGAATRWLGTVEVEAHRWGVDLVPFPGLA
ncbi:DUF4439 domain-containing protein [Oryzobacter terrae]|uniref:DUF4439 domain-containing protein n=1 Tax=Oryzobacter terrae TaxID=1620385 RepID=UPI00366F3607